MTFDPERTRAKLRRGLVVIPVVFGLIVLMGFLMVKVNFLAGLAVFGVVIVLLATENVFFRQHRN